MTGDWHQKACQRRVPLAPLTDLRMRWITGIHHAEMWKRASNAAQDVCLIQLSSGWIIYSAFTWGFWRDPGWMLSGWPVIIARPGPLGGMVAWWSLLSTKRFLVQILYILHVLAWAVISGFLTWSKKHVCWPNWWFLIDHRNEHVWPCDGLVTCPGCTLPEESWDRLQ